MNAKGRKALELAISKIEEARGIIEDLAAVEREKYDNMPDGLQSSEQGERIATVADALENADFDSLVSSLEEARDA